MSGRMVSTTDRVLRIITVSGVIFILSPLIFYRSFDFYLFFGKNNEWVFRGPVARDEIVFCGLLLLVVRCLAIPVRAIFRMYWKEIHGE